MLTLADLFEAFCGIRPEWATQTITEVVVDSRLARMGSLFVALPGEKLDGHEFVDSAFANGAIIAVIERDLETSAHILDLRKPELIRHSLRSSPVQFPICLRVEDSLLALQRAAYCWRRKLDIRVIGITGSVGKTTTKELIAEVLMQRYHVLKNPGNMNNEIGLPLTVLRLTEKHERAVLEMGFYVPGEIRLLCDIAQPHVGVITNIGTTHAERAGSQEDIARGKAELVEALPPAPQGVAVLNYDDPLVKPMADQTRAKIFYYGLSPEAKLWADGVDSLGLEGIRFRLHYRNETLHLRVPLLGRHSVQTVLRTAAVGLVEGLTWQEIVDGLLSNQAQLHLLTVRSDQGALILDDTYNAAPESVLAALNLLGELEGRKIAVLGDMLELGQYTQRGHEMVGVRAAGVVDELITVGKLGGLVSRAARQAGLSSRRNTHFEHNEQVIEYLKSRLTEKDVVLVKGSRGMHMEDIVSGLEVSE